MRIAIVGTGYVGLVSGACFSELGHEVLCVDKDSSRIDSLNLGKVPIFEPGLDKLIARNVEKRRLSFTTHLAAAVNGIDAIFIAVGTPSQECDGDTDLRYVLAAAEEIGRALTGYAVVVTKSTVPVGTNRKVKEVIANISPNAEFDVASNPEFLREGEAIRDFMEPDRIVIGVESEHPAKVLSEIYSSLSMRNVSTVITDLESAEMVKYASNAFLATKITFINEISALCERVGADVKDVSRGMGLDGRIGKNFLDAGPGFGGSCFPKDTVALAHMGREYGARQLIVETVFSVNHTVKLRMVKKLCDLCDGNFTGKKIAILGVTFKQNTDDMRDAPSLTIVPELISGGAEVRVVDPHGRHQGEALLPGVAWHDTPYEAAENADLVVILTEWDEFCALDLTKLAKAMDNPQMADLRNIYSPHDAKRAGFARYDCIGRTRIGVTASDTQSFKKSKEY